MPSDGSTDFTGEDIENIYLCTCVNGKIEDSIKLGHTQFHYGWGQ